MSAGAGDRPARGPRRTLARPAAVIVALAAAGVALAYALLSETPIGRVEGQVHIEETGAPFAGAQISLIPAEDDSGHPTRVAVAGADGRFTVQGVAAGAYNAVAESPAHRSGEVGVTVSEGATTPVALSMSRSRASLELAQHRHTFLPSDGVRLSVRGYVDPDRATDSVHVRLFRAPLLPVVDSRAGAEALAKLASHSEATELPPALLEPAGRTAPQLVLDRDFAITEADGEGFFNKDLALAAPATGLYLAEVSHGDDQVAGWAVVTHLALVVKHAPRQLVAYTVDMESGQAVRGTDVRIYRSGRLAARGATGADGVVELALRERAGETVPMIAAAALGNDATFIRRTEDQFEDSGAYAAYLYTDRPIYRPGQRLYYKGILRRRLPGVNRYAVPARAPVTFELRDPNGDLVMRAAHETNDAGAFAGTAETSPEAPTGTYTLVALVAGERHTQELPVASYQKPEFTVSISPSKPRYVGGERVRMTISATYFFGAPVAGATVRYSVSRTADWAAEYLQGASADDPDAGNEPPLGFRGAYGYSYGEVLAEGQARLDASGKAEIAFVPKVPRDLAGPLEHILTASASVRDAAGREASADGSARVVQGDFRLTVTPAGYVGAPGRPEAVTINARDFDQRPVPGIVVDLEAGYETWQPDGGTATYRRAWLGRAALDAAGSATVALTPPTAGDLRITGRARDRRGRTIAARSWLWVADDRGGDLGVGYSGVSLLTDRRRYAPGETARVLLNTEHLGETAFLTVEGDRLFHTIAVPVTQHSTVVRVPVLADYGPNVYLAVTYVRQKRLVQSQIPLRVAVAAQALTVAVRADRRAYGPGERITYTIRTTDAGGRPVPAEVSLGVVDESIYALQEDDPAALREAFYPRRDDLVGTYDSLAVEYLGDTDKTGPHIVARKRFPDTAFWAPWFRTNAEGVTSASFDLPDSLTAWRATAVAHTDATVVGRGADTVTVSKPFFVRLETPRYLVQGDRSQVLALVHNGTGAPQAATVRLEAPGLVPDGAVTRTVTVASGQIGRVVWPVAAPAPGSTTVRVTAWTQGSRFTDGVEALLVVRPHGREARAAVAGVVAAGGPESVTLDVDPAAVPAETSLTVRLTPSVSSALVGGLEYLVGYPYGCTEQTMDRFYPDLLIRRVLRLSGAADRKIEADLPRMVRDSLERLYRFQHESGAWGWWEHDDDSPWMTAYVLVGLATAREEGFAVSESVLGRARTAARKLVASARTDDQPLLLYALALTGDADAARAARPALATAHMGPEGLAYVVLLDRRLGRDPAAAAARLNRLAARADGMVFWPGPGAGRWSWDWDSRIVTAAALRAVLATAPDDPQVNGIVRWLMLHRTAAYWDNTRDTAWVLAALADYLRAHPENAAPSGALALRVNGRLVQTLRLSGETLREPEVVVRVPGSALRPGPNTLAFQRDGGRSAVFYSAQLRELVAMDAMPPLAGSRVTIAREYRRVLPQKAGEEGWALRTVPTHNVVRPGDWIVVRLTLNVPSDMAYVLIEDPFPAGVEVTERGSADEVAAWNYWWSSVDVRDDRIAFFARTLPRGVHVIEYNLRAQTPGAYRVLPTFLQGMYAADTRSESAETRMDVR